MSEDSAISLTFNNNSIRVSFALGQQNNAPTYNVGQNMVLSATVGDSLSPGAGQSVIVTGPNSGVENILTSLATAVIGILSSPAMVNSNAAAVSVVWTSEEPALRFGLAASVNASDLSQIGDTITGDTSVNWAYMWDQASPDQAVNWIQPNQTEPLTLQGPMLLQIAPQIVQGAVTVVLERLTKPMLEKVPADQRASDLEECFVDICAAFIADLESSVAVQPRVRALDHPAVTAQPLLGLNTFASDARRDAALAQGGPILL